MYLCGYYFYSNARVILYFGKDCGPFWKLQTTGANIGLRLMGLNVFQNIISSHFRIEGWGKKEPEWNDSDGNYERTNYDHALIFTARKRSLGQGNIFIGVCQEFCLKGGGHLLPGGVCF